MCSRENYVDGTTVPMVLETKVGTTVHNMY